MHGVSETLLAALKRALLDPGGEHRLVKAGKLDGLFPGRNGPAGEAAAQALRDGLVEITCTKVKGKTSHDFVRLTARGVDFVHEHESPVHALHELREALRSNQRAIPQWLDDMRGALAALEQRLAADAQKWLQRIDALSRTVDVALKKIESATPPMPAELPAALPWVIDAVNYLDRRQTGGAEGACPFPELFHALVRQHADLSIAAFHEGLRRLNERRVVRLSPAPSPTDLTRPEFALLDRGELLYFAAR
jgi:hypothetical protein